MAKSYMKRYATSLTIKEMQTETMKYHLSLVRMSIIKKTRDPGKDVVKRKHLYTLSRWQYKLVWPLKKKKEVTICIPGLLKQLILLTYFAMHVVNYCQVTFLCKSCHG